MSNAVPMGDVNRRNKSARPVPPSSVTISCGVDPALSVSHDVPVQSSSRTVSTARDLAPNTHFKLQRAVDTVLDDDCTGTSWLTLGAGSTPQDIVTDDGGTGRADLFRLLTSPIGTAFDIHFRVVTTGTPPAVALISDCYQFFVR